MTAATADLTQLAKNLAYASGTGIQQAASDLIKQGATQIQAKAQSNAPVKTGRLRSSIQITYPGKTRAIIGPQALYGGYQEFGTGSRGEFGGMPYEIRPKSKKYLTFKSKNGQWVRAKVVMHPGVPAHPYMRPAAVSVITSMSPQLAKSGALLITKGKNAT